MNLTRTVCMVRGGSEGYGTVREGSGHFLTLSENFAESLHTALDSYVLMRSRSLGSDQ